MSDVFIDSLKAVPLFAELSSRDLKSISSMAREMFHESDRVIVDEGESGASFHLILDGAASVSVGERIVRQLGPGDYFGEISLLDGGPRTATITTTAPTLTLAIPAWRFRELVAKRPELAQQLLLGLCGVVRAQAAAGLNP